MGKWATEWSGRYPNLCSGKWSLYRDGVLLDVDIPFNGESQFDSKPAVERQKVAERDQITAGVKNETAKTEADTNRIIAESLDERNFQKLFIEKWDGKMPLYMGGDGSLYMLLPSADESQQR